VSYAGDIVSKYHSWTRNAIVVLAFGGSGIANITRRFLIERGAYEAFYSRIEREYGRVFGINQSLWGSDIPFALPSTQLPNVGELWKCQPGMCFEISKMQTFSIL
jgi:hypothetical protein